MPSPATQLQQIREFPDLLRYLEDELDWPLEEYGFDDLTFAYEPAELGLKDDDAAKVKTIHQLRPLRHEQPWGVFFVEFEQKKLPVVVLRRILSHLVVKKRAAANAADARRWESRDLLFVSAFGDPATADREIAFAHFHEAPGDLPTLRVLGWDGGNTALTLASVARNLREKLRWPGDDESPDAWRQRWGSAFRHRIGHRIRTADSLAETLAALARGIRDKARTMLAAESERGALTKLFRAFQTALIHDLTPDTFADTYAQTITYGLLTAAISRTDMTGGAAGTHVLAEDMAGIVPVTNPFLKEMLQTFLQVGGRRGGIDFDELGIQDVVELLRGDETDLPAVIRDFGHKNPEKDPVIHFYEHFLSAYDHAQKVKRGVFYTPPAVVSYIVRSVHELLITEFGLADGLADTATWGEMQARIPGLKRPTVRVRKEGDSLGQEREIPADTAFVQVLDPATGTATFLVEVIEVIHRTLIARWRREGRDEAQREAAWNEYVPKHLLPRLHGYELMMAPYAVAHMKIGLKLNETGYRFGTEERARVYLTNALEPALDVSDQFELLAPALAHEAKEVNAIKQIQRFTVVIGNPPYSVSSHNKSPFIESLMTSYKLDLQRERNIQPLSDDYIKFFRFAQYLIDTSGRGVLGVITNHSYLNGVIHRTMRKSLLLTFNGISVTDLHGNSFIDEHPPGGIRDTNVFDIQQGVSIFRGFNTEGRATSIGFSEIWGTGEAKVAILADSRSEIPSTIISPDSDYAFFVPKNFSEREEYPSWPSLSEMFRVNQNGVQTGHDEFSVGFDRENIIKHTEDFFDPNLSDSEVSQRYGLGDNSGWNFPQKRRLLRGRNLSSELLVPYFYRPFDFRFIYYDTHLLKRSSPSIMPHLIGGKNIALFAMRKVVPTFDYSFFGVVNSVVDHGHFYMGNQGSSSCFPLYLLPTQQKLGSNTNREHNFAMRFCEKFSSALQMELAVDGLPVSVAPEDIFYYAYAVFHSPTYRARYAEFLKIDFPRLPLTSSLELFRTLAALGGELVALHLLESPRLAHPITRFYGNDRQLVRVGEKGKTLAAVDADTGLGRVPINGTSGFADVPRAVWDFHVGGYQVCHKWLDDRRKAGRSLSDDDLAHYGKIVVALHETIRLMAEVDAAIEQHGGWPDAFQTPNVETTA